MTIPINYYQIPSTRQRLVGVLTILMLPIQWGGVNGQTNPPCYVCYNDAAATFLNPTLIVDLTPLNLAVKSATCDQIYQAAINGLLTPAQCNEINTNVTAIQALQIPCGCTNNPPMVPTTSAPVAVPSITSAPVAVPTITSAPVLPTTAAPATGAPVLVTAAPTNAPVVVTTAPVVPTTTAPVVVTTAPVVPTTTAPVEVVAPSVRAPTSSSQRVPSSNDFAAKSQPTQPKKEEESSQQQQQQQQQQQSDTTQGRTVNADTPETISEQLLESLDYDHLYKRKQNLQAKIKEYVKLVFGYP